MSAATNPAGAGAGDNADLPFDPRTPSPWSVLPARRRWPLHDAAATRSVEAAALAGLPPHTLMARAGLAVARLVQAVAPDTRGVLALAGPGNNGGDAVLAASLLQRHGRAVRIVLLADPARLPSDAAWALAQAHAAGVSISTAVDDAVGALATASDGPRPVVLDGLLGLGAARAPAGALASLIAALNRARATVVAIDLPSGLDPDRGVPFGAEAVRADHTLALLTLKAGLFTAQGRDHAGRVWLDRLGVAVEHPPTPASPLSLLGPEDAREARGGAAHAAHKGRFGDVVVIGGAAGMGGAVRLAARAALVAGAGRVYATALADGAAAVDPRWPELMQRPLDAWATPGSLATRTIVAGCGGGAPIAAALPPLIAHAARLVLDADALNAVAAEPALQRALAARGVRGRPTVMTPHPLEAARLLGCDAAAVQADRLAACRALVGRFGATVLLKGSGTVIGGPDGRLRINPSGNARLASAGTGDVLAGWIGGRWSRAAGLGGADDGRSDERLAADVAAGAAFVHGRAVEPADGAGSDVVPEAARAGPLTASDLIAAMAAIRC
jgi:hydroxyethylthiazole kinase-like uncharacterized protein yjeF